MLVLTRKITEAIVVPDCNLTITVLATRGNQVTLGIAAPASVAVHRGEVWQRIAEFHDDPVENPPQAQDR